MDNTRFHKWSDGAYALCILVTFFNIHKNFVRALTRKHNNFDFIVFKYSDEQINIHVCRVCLLWVCPFYKTLNVFNRLNMVAGKRIGILQKTLNKSKLKLKKLINKQI